jgi:hypothetical protein
MEKILCEKLTGSQLIKKFPHFMEPGGLLPLLQGPSPIPLLRQISPILASPIPLLEDPS